MKPLFDTDTFREILDSILRNRSRSLLTGFGVFWGVFMLMLLTGGGQGLKALLATTCTWHSGSRNMEQDFVTMSVERGLWLLPVSKTTAPWIPNAPQRGGYKCT